MVSRILALFLLTTACFDLRAQEAREKAPDHLRLIGKETTCQVSPGEGLYQIARRFDLSYMSIAAANGIANPHMIRAGKKLILPTRTILPFEPEKRLVINLPEFRVFFLHEDRSVTVYPACIGLPTWTTPLGEFTVTHMVKNPTWYMPESIAEEEKVKREIIPPGPLNPLGDFWIGTDLDHTGIHGTIVPMSIGRALSHGCLRLYAEDVESLFIWTDEGESGKIIYEPVKVAVSGDSVFLEVHPDVYGFVADYEAVLAEKLKLLNPPPSLDREQVEIILREKRGVPVFAGTVSR
jgi:L,D-transpeptidase ErfK/SrfK